MVSIALTPWKKRRSMSTKDAACLHAASVEHVSILSDSYKFNMKRMTLNQLNVPGAGMRAQNLSGRLSGFFCFLPPFFGMLAISLTTEYTQSSFWLQLLIHFLKRNMVGNDRGEFCTSLVGPQQAVINETPTDTDMRFSRVILQAPPGLFIFPGERLVSHRLLSTPTE